MRKVPTISSFSIATWLFYVPLAGFLVFVGSEFIHWTLYTVIMATALIGTVLGAVHHAEIIAHRIGEPFGSLLLAFAVTLIEASLIISLMIAGGHAAQALARDTVFATIMIILNGMVGVSILAGSLKFKEQTFILEGISSALTILVAISVLTLILPNYTLSVPGPFYSKGQLLFVAIVTLIIYGTFLLVQNVRHREFFLPDADSVEYNHQPSKRAAIFSGLLLVVCLVVVVFLAEHLAPPLESLVKAIHAPNSLVGVIVACVVLMPEGISAFRAARNNQLQKSLNLSLGSALASLGLTIPAVSLFALFAGIPISLGIDVKSTVLFLLSLFVIVLSLSTGKTTILQGAVLVIIFSVYLFTIVFP